MVSRKGRCSFKCQKFLNGIEFHCGAWFEIIKCSGHGAIIPEEMLNMLLFRFAKSFIIYYALV